MTLRTFRMSLFAGKPITPRDLRAWLVKLASCVIFIFSSSVSANQNHDLAALEASVATFLQAHYRQSDAVKVEISINNLDRRLRLTQCASPLVMEVGDPAFNGGNQTVHTRCVGAAPWSVYVPAQITLFRSMVVASRNLLRGDVVSAADFVTEVVNTSALRNGQIADAASIVGKEVKRPINKGEPFRAAALDAPLVIKRGDPVMIELMAGAIAVNTHGIAMANGRVGDRIRVRNGQSDRIVNALVVAAGKVATTI